LEFILHRLFTAALISAALIPFAHGAEPAAKPAADDGVIRPTISETEQLKIEIQRLKTENAALRKQILDLQNQKSAPAKETPAPKDQPAKTNPDSIPAATKDGRPALGMSEETLDAMIEKHKSAGASKTIESESSAGKVVKYDTTLYTFRVFIESGKVIRIYEVNKNKSAIFEPL
jgi:hypothetical protein